MPATEKTSLRLPTGLWARFIAFVVDKHHRTHGGVLGQETAAALEAHMSGELAEIYQAVNKAAADLDSVSWASIPWASGESIPSVIEKMVGLIQKKREE